MKKLIMMVLAATLAAGCASDKEPAELAVTGLETAASNARPEIERFAPDRLAGVDAAVAAVKSKFDGGDYAGALAGVQSASGAVTSAAEAAAARKAQLSAEWAGYAGMPAAIGQIEARIAALDGVRRLPRGLDKTKLDGARSSLDSAKSLWSEASEAHQDGNLALAVSKANQASPIVDSLVKTLGIQAPAQ